jgi:endonuclease YncB( thermonuclease family)
MGKKKKRPRRKPKPAEPLGAVVNLQTADVVPNYNYYGYVPSYHDHDITMGDFDRHYGRGNLVPSGLPDDHWLDSGPAMLPDAYDGDTVRMMVDLGFNTFSGPMYYRLYGIQAPEIRPLKTRKAAITAKCALQALIMQYGVIPRDTPEPLGTPGVAWLDAGTWLYVVSHKTRRKRDHRPKATKGKFGRYLVELFGSTGDGVINLNQEMIRLGHAKPYQP